MRGPEITDADREAARLVWCDLELREAQEKRRRLVEAARKMVEEKREAGKPQC